MPRFSDRLKHAWSAFFGRDAPAYHNYGPGYSTRPDTRRLSRVNARSVVTGIYNRIAVDCASVAIHHVRLDEVGRFKEFVNSGLENCLTTEANIDQTGRAFRQDLFLNLLDEGCIAVLPTKADVDPKYTNGYDIQELRVGRVVEWYPHDVMVEAYDDKTGIFKRDIFPKKMVALPENPFRAVMNEPNSTLQRLQNKLALLDVVDERTSSGRMDMIIQVPYSSRTEMQKNHAENRRKQLESQLENSKYGVAWMDGTEKIIQLNRPIENNLLDQIEALRTELYSQLGLTKEVFEGTADEQVMLNYMNRTVEPIVSAVVDEMKRKWLSKTARSEQYRQTVMYFSEPFKLVPVTELAKIADVLTRNAILSANEIRAILGYQPSEGQRANELINNNMPVNAIGGQPAMAPGGNPANPDSTIPTEPQAETTQPKTDMMDTPISALTG